MPGRAAVKSFRIKIARRCDKVRHSISRVTFTGGSRAGEIARVSGRDIDFASLRHQHIGARVPMAYGWNQQKPPAFSTPPARPANLKVCSVMSADMRWRWRPRWTPFWRQSGRRVLLCFGYRLGGRAFVYRLRAAAGGDGDYRLRRIADWPDCGVWWKIVENIRLAACSQRRPPFAC